MVFLPIVERELRVATRRKSTYRVRLWTTLAGVVVSFFFMLAMAGAGRSIPSAGRTLFNILTWYAFGLSLLAGVLLAADCLSEEKREGTLGLLFLTDLKGYDVVLGKLIAVGVSALYGLVAVLPVTGLSLLMGGLTGGEYWRTALALVNTLFFALATGLMVSSWSRDAMRAMSNTLGLLFIAVVGLPVLGRIASIGGLVPGSSWLAAASPYLAFSSAAGISGRRFWISLLVSHLTGWLFLLLASWSLPRSWQDKPFRARPKVRAWWAFQWFGTNRGVQPAVRARLIDQNPILWLAGSNQTVLRGNWIIAIFGGALIVGIALLSGDGWGIIRGSITSWIWVFGGLLKLLVAVHAPSFFADARRSGALELIVSTPLTRKEIIEGQWLALKRLFMWPGLVFLAAQVIVLGIIVYELAYDPNTGWNMAFWPLIGIPYHMAVFVADFFALGWLGMWLGLTAKKPNFAAAMTIFFGLVIPRMALCVPDLIIDVILISWARGKLTTHWSRVAKPEYHPLFPYPGFQQVPAPTARTVPPQPPIVQPPA